MRHSAAIGTLFALANDTRLRVYQMLLDAGPEGMPTGSLVSALTISPTSLSGHLAILARAGVVTKERRGRSMIYRARMERVHALARLLAES